MKHLYLSLVLIMIPIAAILGMTSSKASLELEKSANPGEEKKIQDVIQNYFERRYHSRAVNQVEDLSDLTDGSSQSESFLKSETDKLEIEIRNAKLHHLGYTSHEFTLDFKDISIDLANQSATVSLTEGHDVIFEVSAMTSKTDPIVSKMRNLYHTIFLKKTQNGWRIVSDNYEDYLWRMLRTTHLVKDELLSLLVEAQDQTSTISDALSPTFSCNLPSDDSTHPYDRIGSVAYARQHAISPNPAYHYFVDDDCTNFVNQAIHHGSNAEEVGSSTFGWYYNYYNSYLDNDYSASWTDVQFLYDFIEQYYVWPKGPEGCDTDYNNALPGDLVQFEWPNDGDTDWDHSVIIVIRGISSSGFQYWVSGHSEDIDAYPLDSIIYESRRFVRIERIDGFINAYLPIVMRGSSGYLENIMTDPYPAPMESGGSMQLQNHPTPYPAP